MFNLWQFLRVFLVFSSVYANYCTIRMPSDVPLPTPVILTETGLFRPTESETIIKEQHSITLLCPGRGNIISALNQTMVTLTCKKGSFSHDLKNMKCKSVPTSELQETYNICAGGNGVFYEVGFSYKNTFHSIFEICFNKQRQRAIYSRNLINGNMQYARAKRGCGTPLFRSQGVFGNPDNSYTKDNQKERFKNLFGANQKYVADYKFFARGHIAPLADFIFCYEQFATFYYANCAPEWQDVNAGNWVRVENAVRGIASSKRSNLLVFTGTLGILELPHPTTYRYTSIYLDENKTLVVPKWFYKVVMHPSLPIDIVFITLNNPYASNGPDEEFCTNICREYGLDSPNYALLNRGYTFCCEFKNFWATAMGANTPYYELPNGWSYKY